MVFAGHSDAVALPPNQSFITGTEPIPVAVFADGSADLALERLKAEEVELREREKAGGRAITRPSQVMPPRET